MSGLLTPVTAQKTINEATSDIEKICNLIAHKDFLFMTGEKTKALLEQQRPDALEDLEEFTQSWSDLYTDAYMADKGTYRKRRHATMSAPPSSKFFHLEAHQPHFQSLYFNNLNGDVKRLYRPISSSTLDSKILTNILRLGCDIFGRLSPYSSWHIEIHQFRIEAGLGGAATPTPEGIHRDGVGFVMMLMVKRINIANGATSIYDLEKRRLNEFTLRAPLDMAIVNDERVFHSVAPLIQLDCNKDAYRDVLVVTFRKKCAHNFPNQGKF
ncbi:2OG-Fe dioxygenase family protein [Glaciimonas sp. PCH181]|uniref:2OG-Fe dioxygenase family protein n=1 Tax=Glaciimonas sp. PCH181 TaxID=2133943 RepID=UPI000D3543B7|nr:2OG-Fe dioxygenase family protein [Glaciimonas sp. PCH181]PUA20321.1 hypothetical protein C7W93_11290 [Glaciimonas sp. PCH181]